jgi:hypothetical protein
MDRPLGKDADTGKDSYDSSWIFGMIETFLFGFQANPARI